MIVDIYSNMDSCDNEICETDANYKCLLNEYNFETDIEKLIQVSKQFQSDYENEKAKSDAASDDNCFNIPILSSNSLRRQKTSTSEVVLPINDRDNFYFSSRSSTKENDLVPHSVQSNKPFTPTVPHPGPFGTGITRPSPKKHSCIQRSDTTTAKRSHHFGWSVKPYTSRYYNFDRTHPSLKLVESGISMIPKRISKQSKENTEPTTPLKSDIIVKPLLHKGLTWHEFFERCNVYSSKSFQSSYGDAHTTDRKPSAPELLTPKSNETSKIQKHILPQMNIKAECCVQRIPEISIAPCFFKRTMNTNIKLVEIIYDESNSKVETVQDRHEELFEKVEQKTTEPLQLQSKQSAQELPSENVEVQNIEASANESNSTLTYSSSTTPSKSNGYDSSLEESISLNVSRASAAISRFRDPEIKSRSVKNVGIQTQKIERMLAHRKEDAVGRTITSSSDHKRLEYGGYFHQPQEEFQEIKLPTFPADELVQMMDEIFDTSSDAVNMSYKYIVKETSVQTDIVWENINELFKQQDKPTLEPSTEAERIKFTEPCGHATVNFVDHIETERPKDPPSNVVKESEEFDNRHLMQGMEPVERCRHSRLKKIKICSCLACKSNIRFSSVNINESIQRTLNDSSSSPVFQPRPIRSSAKVFPSERYKRMKQAQREHFESDPRISRTLKKIYATARKNKLRKETISSSSSSGHDRKLNLQPRCEFSTYDDELLEPDLFTFSDEMLLFGLQSYDEIQYSSNLLKTESSQDTSMSVGKCYAVDDSINRTFLENNLFCTNSEDSNCNSGNGQRVSQLEQFLLKDIENSGSDPSALSSLLSTSSLERKMREIQLKEQS